MESQSAEKVRRVQERRRSGASGKHQRGERRVRTRSASRRRAITQED